MITICCDNWLRLVEFEVSDTDNVFLVRNSLFIIYVFKIYRLEGEPCVADIF